MIEETNIKEVVEEIKTTDEDILRETIEKWYERIRTDGIKIGAKYMSSAIYGIIQKHLKKTSPSLRDYKRMTDEIIKIISVQIVTQNDSEEIKKETVEEIANDE